jgi:hypothetical protein
MQESGESLSRRVVLSRDRAFEQVVLDVLRQVAPSSRDRFSECQQERGYVIARAHPLVFAVAFAIDDLDASMISPGSACVRSEAAAIKNSVDTPAPSSLNA